MQKFKRGDIVHVNKELPPYMNHFRADFDAIIIGSYADQYGGSDVDSYTIMEPDTGGTISWYYTSNLSFVREGHDEEIQEIERQRAMREQQESDLVWIVKNWPRIRENPSGFTMCALMKLIGITNPWGRHGEGFVYHGNAMNTHAGLDSALSTGDMAVVEKRIADVKAYLAGSYPHE